MSIVLLTEIYTNGSIKRPILTSFATSNHFPYDKKYWNSNQHTWCKTRILKISGKSIYICRVCCTVL